MSPFILLGLGILLPGLGLAAFVRWRSPGHPAVAEAASIDRESGAGVPLDRLPDSMTLAGVPLRILLSDRAGTGTLLRDTLLIRPSARD